MILPIQLENYVIGWSLLMTDLINTYGTVLFG
mgnify:CR=1 FL=1